MPTPILKPSAFADEIDDDLAVQFAVLAGERIRFVEFHVAGVARPDQAVPLVITEHLLRALPSSMDPTVDDGGGSGGGGGPSGPNNPLDGTQNAEQDEARAQRAVLYRPTTPDSGVS